MTPRADALCRLLDIEYPILQSGMSRVAGAELVAEVSKAGGLGILAALRLTPDELRNEIEKIRGLTDRPFGVNLWLHPGVVHPVAPSSIQESALVDVQHTLDEFRAELAIPSSSRRPAAFPDLVARNSK
jgi:NAD(P)H-dependent flavin oxidoreductase YrpB (nitropropane dioxygenase family)